MRWLMKWLISVAVFLVIVTGFGFESIGQSHESTPGAAKEESAEGSAEISAGKSPEPGHKHDIGVAQPRPNPELGTLPPKVDLLEPAAFHEVSGNSVTLKWKPVAGDDIVYHVQVASDSRFKWVSRDEMEVKENQLELTNLKSGEQVFWRVAARALKHDPGWTHGAFNLFSSFNVK